MTSTASPSMSMTGDEKQRRAAERAVLVATSREHSAAVNRHLERVAGRLREHGRAPLPLTVTDAALPRLATTLGDLSRLLLADTSDDAVLTSVLALTRSGVEGCDGASVTLVHDGSVETASATGDDVARSDRLQYLRRAGPCYHAATTGRTTRADALDDGEGGAWASVVSAPLRSAGSTIGALNVYARNAVLGEGARVVAELVADHAARALVRARSARAQRTLASSLQLSLLPPELPELPGVRLAARYDPASAGMNVGGDWYDVLVLPDGRVLLVIGDVAGHGLQAAMTMGQLRTAVRAYALEGHDPARILRLLDTFLQQIDPEGYATCVVAALDPATGSVRWANAGHPDPLVVLPGAAWRPLAGRAHLSALGVPAPGETAARCGADVLPSGARLLMFTDGLVERRTEALDVGVERLATTALSAEGTGVPLQSWCDGLVAAQIGDDEVGDDVAVLAVELTRRPSEPLGLARDDLRTRVAG